MTTLVAVSAASSSLVAGLPVSGVLVVAEPPAQTAARDTIGFAQIKGSGINAAAPSPDGIVTPVEVLLNYGYPTSPDPIP